MLRSRLIGHWHLASFVEHQASGEPRHVLGAGAKGSITYTASGHVVALIGGSERPLFSGAWAGISDSEKAKNYDGLVAYGGRFTAYENRVVHHVDVCWIPNWEGTDLERFVTFLPDGKLLLRTPPMRHGRPQPLQEVVWEKAAGTTGGA